ncbi:MAG TPA: hypothetical protein ENN80_02090, partial [Candidatus Hydrogenedentes bacterium]|nr:hypothetical protein [Candidatus Hydrogenedentota bacterium]
MRRTAFGRDVSFLCTLGLLMLSASARPAQDVLRDNVGNVTALREVLDIQNNTQESRGEREPSDPGRYIVQFTAPPLAKQGPKAIRAIEAEHTCFAADLAALRGIDPATKTDLKAALGIRQSYYRVWNGVALALTPAERATLRKKPYVERIVRDGTVHAHIEDSVPLINADQVWVNPGITGDGIVVAIIDTGVDYEHPDLGGGIGPGHKVLGGIDIYNEDDDPMDDHGHGTHCAGIVAANGSLVGVAPYANLMAIKVLSASGSGEWSHVIAGIEWAVDPDGNPGTDDAVDVISMSLGGAGDPDDPPSQAIDNAVAMGVVCAVSAGNQYYYEKVGTPGCARAALTVGATDKSDRLADFSSRGPVLLTSAIKPEVCAPGVSIVSAAIGGGTRTMSGTSMSCPHVAGAAALLLEQHPSWTPGRIKAILANTAVDLGLEVMAQGAGRIDVLAAAQAEVVIEPGTLNLGYNNLALSTWAASETLTVTNLSGATISCSFSVDGSALPGGVTTSIDPSLALAPGASDTITFEVTVDNTVVPNLHKPPYVYYGCIEVQCGASVLRTPFAFNNEQPDTMEPNNHSTEATLFTIHDTRRQVVELGRTRIDPTQPGASEPDQDWYRFEGEAGDVLFLYIDSWILYSGLDPILSLYASDLTLLEEATYEQGDPRIVFYTIPTDDTYYVQVRGDQFPGRYRLFANILPEAVRWWWISDEPEGGNPIYFTEFSDGGDYIYTGQWHQRMTLLPTASGVPEYTLIGASNSILATAKDASTVYSVLRHTSGEDTWTFTGADWVLQSPPAVPGRLGGHAMAYDAARNGVLLFGGRHQETGFTDQTWTWDGTTWTLLHPAHRPPPRLRAKMTYDSEREVVVLFGGIGGSIFDYHSLDDTWEWDGADWTQVVTVSAPSARFSSGLVFDSVRNVAVLFGGYGEVGWLTDTWEYDGVDWTLIEPPSAPEEGYSVAMAYDSTRGETVLLSNYPVETWTWDGTDWTQHTPATPPGVSVGAWAMAFDAGREVMVLASRGLLFDDQHITMETWEWDGADWASADTTSAPTIRSTFDMVYDAGRGQTLLFGGWLSTPLEDLRKRSTPSATIELDERWTYPNSLTRIEVAADGSRAMVASRKGDIQVRDAAGAVVK